MSKQDLHSKSDCGDVPRNGFPLQNAIYYPESSNRMLILRPSDSSLDIEVRGTLLDIQQLAQQIVCYYEDMNYAEGRTHLLRLPIPLLPQPAMDINNLFHEKMVRGTTQLQSKAAYRWEKKVFMFEWAERRHFSIHGPILQGPQILSLQDGGMSVEDHTISICIIIPRPKRSVFAIDDVVTASGNSASDGRSRREDLPVKGAIKSPIAESQCVTSLFECQIGNIIILEEGEVILVRDLEEGVREGHDICMLTALHGTNNHKEGQ